MCTWLVGRQANQQAASKEVSVSIQPLPTWVAKEISFIW